MPAQGYYYSNSIRDYFVHNTNEIFGALCLACRHDMYGGKKHLTDVADQQQLFRIIQSFPIIQGIALQAMAGSFFMPFEALMINSTIEVEALAI